MKIVTHNGRFHADEVMACAIISLLAEHKGQPVEMVRTRNKWTLSAAVADNSVIVFDVGGEYNVEMNNFDHHQKSFTLARNFGKCVPYSSAGLAWLWFGRKLPTVTENVWSYIDHTIISDIDARDTGFDSRESAISSVISALNPSWMEDSIEAEDNAFATAVATAKHFLKAKIAYAAGLETAKQVVQNGHRLCNGKILLLEQFAPWTETVCRDESFSSTLYVCFPDKTGKWIVQTVPESVGSFVSRKKLPAHWGGLQDEHFSKVAGIPDGTFCHKELFICGCTSKNSALMLAEKAINA